MLVPRPAPGLHPTSSLSYEAMKNPLERRNFLKVASVGLLPLAVPLKSAAAPSNEEATRSREEAARSRPHGGASVLIDQRGPLPITKNIQIENTGPVMLFVSGSVWTQSKESSIGFEVLVDGKKVGQAAIYSNQPLTHRSVVPVYLPAFLNKPWTGNPPTTPPTYAITLQPLDGTSSDRNDHFQVTLFG